MIPRAGPAGCGACAYQTIALHYTWVPNLGRVCAEGVVQRFIIKRLIMAFFVFWGVCVLIFVLSRALPGDMVTVLASQNPAGVDVESLRHFYGFDKPIWEQYLTWQLGVFQGDLGLSMETREPVLSRILARLPLSVEIALLAVAMHAVLGITLGVIAARRQDRSADYGIRLYAIASVSVPTFWTGTLLVLLPSLWFHYAAPLGFSQFLQDPLRNLQQIAFPVLAMGLATGGMVRMTRSSVLEVLRQDYVRTARAKGLGGATVLRRHVLKNALIPVVTMLGMEFAALLGGVVIMETIFNLPGIGLMLLTSITRRDYTQVQGTVLFLSTFIVLMNLLVDLAYGWLDPRIRYD